MNESAADEREKEREKELASLLLKTLVCCIYNNMLSWSVSKQ